MAASSPRAPRPRRRPDVEGELLALARDLSVLARGSASRGEPIAAALGRLGEAFSSGAALPRRFFAASLRIRDDKAAALAFAWAREQVRHGLREVLEGERERGRVRGDITADTLSWLLLAASEATAHEPADVARDRVAAMLEFVRPPRGLEAEPAPTPPCRPVLSPPTD